MKPMTATAPIRDRITELRRVKASELLANPRNWRKHPSGQAAALSAVLREVGYADALLARETPHGLELIDGHLRQKLTPDQEVPVLVLDVTEEEANKILLTLDPLAALAESDKQALDTLLRDVTTGDAALQEMLAGLAKENGLSYGAEPPPAPEPEIDRAEELQRKWGTELGQFWQIGRHRLLCGDWREGIEGMEAEFGMHDPPYGISVVGGSKGFGSIGGSQMVAVNRYSEVEGDNEPFDPLPLLAVSPRSVLWGANYYCDKLPTTKGWIVWDKKGREDWRDTFSDCELAWSPFDVTTRLYHHTWMGMVQEGQREMRFHPTQKPSELYVKILNDLFPLACSVADYFLGTGTTMVAAEQTGRSCYGIEIEPKYAAVTLERLSQMNLEAKLINA